jgi:hypothetical protein
MARVMDWAQYDALKAQGLADREIARRWEIPWGTFHREKQKRQGPPSTVHPTPDDRIPSTVYPAPSTADHLQADLSAALATALQPVLARLEALERGLAPRAADERSSTVHGGSVDRPPSHPDTSTVHPAPVDPATWELRALKHSERWTIYVPRAMREEIKRRAEARKENPSILVQEALQQWLAKEQA